MFPWLQGWLAESYAKDTTESLARGATPPPIVGRVAGEKFVVIDGVHRLTAWLAVGRDRVLAHERLS